MSRYVAGYVAALVVMVALDMLWLGVIAKSFYQQGIGHLMADQPNMVAALAFYLIYAAGLVLFVLGPYGEDPLWGRTLLMGALFGFCAYATYDLSNLATLKDWPVTLTVIDIFWGAIISLIAVSAGKTAILFTRG